MTSLKTSIKTITYLSDIGCLEIQGASLQGDRFQKSGSTDTDKNSTYLPAQSEPECYTAPAAVNVTDNSYSTALIHHHTTAAAV
ncbi:hypothetical protein ODW73_23295, partial [Escherichia coli]|nr:hypothetical protein [Escherichia coli]